MKVYVTWTPIPGATGYAIYRFTGTLDEIWQYRDEFWKPDGGCVSGRDYPLISYMGSTEHFELIDTTSKEDIPPKWNITYLIDDVPPGNYIYIVRALDDECAGPISDPITVTVDTVECPEDEKIRYDGFKVEGEFLVSHLEFEREYGIGVEIKEITIESTYTSPYGRLFYVFAQEDIDNGKYVYVPPFVANITEKPDIYSPSGIIIIDSIPLTDWQLLYGSSQVEWAPPTTIESDAYGVTSVDVRYRVKIKDIPQSIFKSVLPNIINDTKHIEGAILPGMMMLGRMYPVSGTLKSIDIEFTYPPEEDFSFMVGNEDAYETIVIPAGTRSFIYGLDIDITPDRYLLIMSETAGGTSADIHLEIEIGDIYKICVPYECIDFDGVFIEGGAISETEEVRKYDYDGLITRIFIDSRYPNESVDPVSIRLQNKRTLEYVDVSIESGERSAFICGHLAFKAGDTITITPTSDTTLTAINVLWELWTCGYDYIIEPEDISFNDYVFIDGWKIEGGVIPNYAVRYRTYPFWTKIQSFHIDSSYVFPNDITADVYIDANKVFSFVIPAGSLHSDHLCDILLPPGKIMSIQTNNTGLTSPDITWWFSVPDYLNISIADDSSWIRDHATIEGGVVADEYCIRDYDKNGAIKYITANSRYTESSDIILYLENETSGEVLTCTIPSGSNNGSGYGNLTFSQGDIIKLKSTTPGFGTSVNVDWRLYTTDSNIPISPDNLDFLWCFIEGGAITNPNLWSIDFDIDEKLVEIEISTAHNDDSCDLIFEIGGVDYAFTIPAGVAHIVFSPDIQIHAGDTLLIKTTVGSYIGSINVNATLYKTNVT